MDEGQLAEIERTMEKGYLDGSQMATAFNLLRSGDLIWPYFVNNYLKGKEPLPFDLLFWNADATRMAKANHLFYLRNCYLENRLSRGLMQIGGVQLDLSTIKLPVYNLATKEDHIAPALSVFEGSRALGAPVTYVVSGQAISPASSTRRRAASTSSGSARRPPARSPSTTGGARRARPRARGGRTGRPGSSPCPTSAFRPASRARAASRSSRMRRAAMSGSEAPGLKRRAFGATSRESSSFSRSRHAPLPI